MWSPQGAKCNLILNDSRSAGEMEKLVLVRVLVLSGLAGCWRVRSWVLPTWTITTYHAWTSTNLPSRHLAIAWSEILKRRCKWFDTHCTLLQVVAAFYLIYKIHWRITLQFSIHLSMLTRWMGPSIVNRWQHAVQERKEMESSVDRWPSGIFMKCK